MRKSAREIEKITLTAWDKEARKRYPRSKGWCTQPSTKGFPDRVYFNRNTRELVLVEVKTGKHNFHQFQQQLLYMLIKGRKRKALLINYELKNGRKAIRTSEINALSTKAKGWEGVEAHGLI